MLASASSSQYLHPDYMQPPLSSTFDSKQSPLVLLAQTCNSIGRDGPTPSSKTPATSLLTSSHTNVKDASKDNVLKTSSKQHQHQQQQTVKSHSGGNSGFKLTSPSVSRSSSGDSSPEFPANHARHQQETAENSNNNNSYNNSSSDLATLHHGRQSAHRQQQPSPLSAVALLSKSSASAATTVGDVITPSSLHYSIGQFYSPILAGNPGGSGTSSTSSSMTSPQSYVPPLPLPSASMFSSPLSSSALLGDAMTPSTSSIFSSLHSTSSLFRPLHHALGLASSASASLNNAPLQPLSPLALKLKADSLSQVTAGGGGTACKDPLCIYCPLSLSHALAHVPSPFCPPGCALCVERTSILLASQVNALAAGAYHSLAPLPSSLLTPPPSLMTSPTSTQQTAPATNDLAYPFVCSWPRGSQDRCAKRFATYLELLQHLHAHASLTAAELQSHASFASDHLIGQSLHGLATPSSFAANRHHPYKSLLHLSPFSLYGSSKTSSLF